MWIANFGCAQLPIIKDTTVVLRLRSDLLIDHRVSLKIGTIIFLILLNIGSSLGHSFKMKKGIIILDRTVKLISQKIKIR